MQEEWRDVVGFEGLYQVSNLGRIKRIGKTRGAKIGRICLPYITRLGYLMIGLHKSNKRVRKQVHRLVAEAFISNPENKPEIDHIDGNQQNNNVDNLRWATKKENMNNPITKKRKSIALKGKTGVFCPNSKPIICVELNKLYWGTAEAGRLLKIDQSSITRAIKGKCLTVGGYHWRYATDDDMRELAAQCGAVCTV